MVPFFKICYVDLKIIRFKLNFYFNCELNHENQERSNCNLEQFFSYVLSLQLCFFIKIYYVDPKIIRFTGNFYCQGKLHHEDQDRSNSDWKQFFSSVLSIQ